MVKYEEYGLIKWRNNFVSGYTGLSLAFALMHPLDTLKTQIQAGKIRRNGRLKYHYSELKESFGGLRRGFFASVIGAGPQGGARLSTYEFFKHKLSKQFPDNKMATVVVSAVLGDLASSIFKQPREVITTRMQVSSAFHDTQNLDAIRTAKAIFQREGIGGFFRGFYSTTARDCPFMIILFSSYETLKSINSPFSGLTGISLLYGGMSGAMAGYLTTPFDVIKTQILLKSSEAIKDEDVRHPISKVEQYRNRNLMQGMSQNQNGKNVIINPSKTPIITKVDYVPSDNQRKRAVAAGGMRPMSSLSLAAGSQEFGNQPRILDVSKEILRQRGVSGLFSGAIPRSAWWFGVCSVFFPTYEATKEFMNSHESLGRG